MLIERMQSNPEEFTAAYDARWRDLLDCARQTIDEDEHSEVMSKRDAKAIMEAYDTHILESKLAERILNELMEPKDRDAKKEQPALTQREMAKYAQDLLEQEYKRRYQAEEARHIAAQQNSGFGRGLGNRLGSFW